MTERLKILKHHVAIIEDNEISGENVEEIPLRVSRYMKEHVENHGAYEFTGEEQWQNFTKAIEKAAVAIAIDDYQPISDFKNKKKGIRNFDEICFNCPNFTLENELFVCMAEGKFITLHEMSVDKK
jgi:hypothetical protein